MLFRVCFSIESRSKIFLLQNHWTWYVWIDRSIYWKFIERARRISESTKTWQKHWNVVKFNKSLASSLILSGDDSLILVHDGGSLRRGRKKILKFTDICHGAIIFYSKDQLALLLSREQQGLLINEQAIFPLHELVVLRLFYILLINSWNYLRLSRVLSREIMVFLM